jgi:hypothetical protein
MSLPSFGGGSSLQKKQDFSNVVVPSAKDKFEVQLEYAKYLIEQGVFGTNEKSMPTPTQAVLLLQKGFELGFTPMQAPRFLYIHSQSSQVGLRAEGERYLADNNGVATRIVKVAETDEKHPKLVMPNGVKNVECIIEVFYKQDLPEIMSIKRDKELSETEKRELLAYYIYRARMTYFECIYSGEPVKNAAQKYGTDGKLIIVDIGQQFLVQWVSKVERMLVHTVKRWAIGHFAPAALGGLPDLVNELPYQNNAVSDKDIEAMTEDVVVEQETVVVEENKK